MMVELFAFFGLSFWFCDCSAFIPRTTRTALPNFQEFCKITVRARNLSFGSDTEVGADLLRLTALIDDFDSEKFPKGGSQES